MICLLTFDCILIFLEMNKECSVLKAASSVSKLLIIVILIPVTRTKEDSSKVPVILVHGVGGSRLQGTWDLDWVPNAMCSKTSNHWENIWLRFKDFLTPASVQCWANKMFMEYDADRGICTNRAGMETRVRGNFGDTEPEEYMGKKFKFMSYYSQIVGFFLDHGYKRRVNLFGACYDWRLAAHELEQLGYYKQLINLVQHIKDSTQKKPVLIAHSMGGLVLAYFLNQQPQQWKDQYIASFITLSTPWLGSLDSLSSILEGNTFSLPNTDKKVMRNIQRTYHSVMWLLPAEKMASKPVLVEWKSKSKSYTSDDYQMFFKDIGFDVGYKMRQDLVKYTPPNLSTLGVKFVCIWSNNMENDTLTKIDINGNDLENEKSFSKENSDGDGTVPLWSLNYCRTAHSKSYVFMEKEILGLYHTPLVQSEAVIFFVYELINGNPCNFV